MDSASKVAARYLEAAPALTVTLDGVRCKWVRDPKSTGRMSIGRADNKFRGWTLQAPDGSYKALVAHTYDVPSYATPKEPPAWKIMIRLDAKESDRAQHGAHRQFTLKARVPAPDGDEDPIAMARALNLAVAGYEKQRDAYNAA